VKLRFEQVVAAPLETLFEFHCNPANLAVLLEGWRDLEVLEHDGHIRVGARARVRQKTGVLRHAMTMEHFVFERPVRFGERQVRGPFARFEHVHEFAPADGGTSIVDRVDFKLPWYLGGVLAERAIVVPELKRFFALRRAAYARLCESGRFR
jgi:ligand-binding SRPBCC domain-containing protein